MLPTDRINRVRGSRFKISDSRRRFSDLVARGGYVRNRMVFPRLPLLSEEDEPDLSLGGVLFTLLDDPEDWVHRRVESAVFLDASSIKRRVSVDFDMPTDDASGEQVSLVPLAVLDKRPLVDLDVRDESGSAYPVLNADENAFAAWSLLSRVVAGVLSVMAPGQAVPKKLLDDLKLVVSGAPSEAADKVTALQKLEDPLLNRALNLSVFVEYAHLLAARFLLLVETPNDERHRRILKFSYTEQFEPVRGRTTRRLFETVGWRATEATVDVPGVGESQSFHFEFQGPPGLQVQSAQLFCANPNDKDDPGRVHQGRVVGSRAHIYTSDEDLSVDGTASVWLRPGRPGLLRASLATAAVVSVLFAFFLWDSRITQVRHGLTLPLLLAAPGLVASFIVRPGEHGMTTDLLAGVRACIGLIALCAYTGAIGLAGEVSDKTLYCLWAVLGIVAALCLTALGVAYLAAGRVTTEEDVDDEQTR